MPLANSTNTLNDHPHNYYNSPPSTAWKASVTDSVGLALTTILILARLYTKIVITKSPGREDYTIVLAWIVFILFATFEFIQRFHYGGGRHSYDLPPELYYGYFWTDVIAGYMYIIGTCIAKISLLLLLYRIFRIDFRFRIASWILGTVIAVWTTTTMLLSIFACKPIRASWDLNLYLAPTTRCPIKAYNVLNIHGFCNVITDFALLILPIPMVLRLHTDTRKKVGLGLVFGTGAFICAVSVVRQYVFYHTDKTGDNYKTIKLKIWESLELWFSIIVACLPALTPLFKKIKVLANFVTTIRTKNSRSRTGQRGPWPQKASEPSQDIERNALRSDPQPPTSWQVPRAWQEAGKRGSDDGASHESDVTLQELHPQGHMRTGSKESPPSNRIQVHTDFTIAESPGHPEIHN